MATRRAPHRAARLRPYFWSQCFPYIHQPLSTKNNEIRLMILEPAHNLAETLLVRLVHVRLANNTPYFALSYVWGDPAPKDFVLIGDRKLGITENLGKALRRIRQVHPDAEVVLWADGICINQHSIIERNHQVGIMGSIYKGAAEVFVWIDEYLDTKSPLFEQIMARSKSTSEFSAPILLSDCSNSCLVNVINVFQNPYWKRLWVQGELINAAKLRVLFRNCVMFDNEIRIFTREIVRSLHGMLRYVGHLRNLDEQLMDALRYTIFNYVGIGYHALAEESGQHWAQERLTDLMHHGRILSVTNPRDFVFGLMHIANDYNDGDIKVDYEKSVQEVFLLAFHHHVGWHRDLRFLDIVQYGDPDLPRVAMEFPEESWMQVWTNRSTLERSWPAAAIPCLADAVSCSSNVIHVHGFTLSSLSKVTTMLPEPGQTEHSLIQQMTRLFEAMPSLLQSDCLGSEEQVNSLMEILEADGLSDDWGLSVFENVLGALNVLSHPER